MAERRKDKKGRVLRDGEIQRKDGLYQYSYTDTFGERKVVYSWKLEPNDTLPSGKRKCLSLREKEREIQKSLNDNIVPYGGSLTVMELVEKYILQKQGVRETTRMGYKTVVNILKKESFSRLRIDAVKQSDAKFFLIKLQREDKRKYSTIHTIRGVLRPAFRMAYDDDLIKKNPFDFSLSSVVINDSFTREAITHDQKRRYLEFIKNDPHFKQYYEGIYILFYTGLRISEFTGLTLSDIDMENKTITIDHQLMRLAKMKDMIVPPKTKAGNRVIPMKNGVYECFKVIIENRTQMTFEKEYEVDGKTGFLYVDKNGRPLVAYHWEKYMQHSVEKYNSIYKHELPKITPHICRHTYCSHSASSGMNPKTLQYLMGHSDIGVTLNTYTHVDMDKIFSEVVQYDET